MQIIGITGGVGSGKSRVLGYLRECYGTTIVRLDDLGRAVMEKGAEAYEDVLALFGEDVLLENGEFDRSAIANIVLVDPSLKKQLEAAVFPRVRTRLNTVIEEARGAGCPLLVIESAILIENGYMEICDEVWYIYADIDTRVARLRSSRGYSDFRIYNTMFNQLSEAEFRENANVTISNNGNFSETAREVDRRLAAMGINRISCTDTTRIQKEKQG